LKTILITGTTNGIGRITAMELAKAGHTIVMANRNRVKSEQTQAEIIAQTGNDNIELLDLDLSSLDSVRACAEAFKTSHNTLDILINNAGLTSQTELLSKDGYELQFAVNALAQLEFTLELLPVLESAAPSQVIFVTSMMHKFGKLNFNSFEGWKKYSGGGAYNQSKLAIMLLARELAERVEDRKIAVNTLHPGAVNTGILDGYSKTVQFFLRKLFISVEKGAKTSLFLACQESKSLPTGRYFVNCKEASAHKLLANTVMREKLWDQCCEYLNRTSAP
jgi:NAD(P)-dependent dehydrogenase (short-subunit alcohol dehydrogenase family)